MKGVKKSHSQSKGKNWPIEIVIFLYNIYINNIERKLNMEDLNRSIQNCRDSFNEIMIKRRKIMNDKSSSVVSVWRELISKNEATLRNVGHLLNETRGFLKSKDYTITTKDKAINGFFGVDSNGDNCFTFTKECVINGKYHDLYVSVKNTEYKMFISVSRRRHYDNDRDDLFDFVLNLHDNNFRIDYKEDFQNKIKLSHCIQILDTTMEISEICIENFDDLTKEIVNMVTEYVNEAEADMETL